MYVWPVPQWQPQYSYHQPPRSFGSGRSYKGKKNARKHAGCDLYAPDGSPVIAIADGRVRSVYEFYGKAHAIEVDHGSLGIVRYGEIHPAAGIRGGMLITPGAAVGTIATLVGIGHVHPMLHLEMYSGRGTGRLTQHGNEFHRRSDLVDPTEFLDRIRLMSFVANYNVA